MLEGPPHKCKPGAPAWLATFADLMSLLMCFFVLLLSFSELDAQKYKQVAGSMAKAFGVQRKITTDKSPMGTSFIAREFSPGRPDPTVIKVLMQKSTHERPFLRIVQNRVRVASRRLLKELETQRRKGLVSVETEPTKIIVRIHEKGSFPSGSAELTEAIQPVMATVAEVLADTPGTIIVSGHTDDVPIATARFRSNWELSAARAVTVLDALARHGGIAPERLVVRGHAETKPLVPNDSPENRALNRRVEIVVEQAVASRRRPGPMPPPGQSAAPLRGSDT